MDVLGIQVLGPVRAWRGDSPIDLGPAGQRGLLGLLALAMGQPLSRAELTTAMWGERPPPTATNMIQTRMKHLRRLLEPERRSYGRSTVLPSVGDGYTLRTSEVRLDLPRFRQLVADAYRVRQQGDHRQVATLLREALGLWQGPPLGDVPFLASHAKVVALVAERQAAVALCGEAMLAVGAVDEVLPLLAQSAVEQPLDEAAAARLIRAYQRAGRRAQAFDEYHAIRRRLADELGVDPGPTLAAAHAALLRDESAPAAKRKAPAFVAAPPSDFVRPPERESRPVPAQLPADIAVFTGRAEQLRRLDELAGNGAGNATVVVSLSGPAGVGKTALAVRWAHRVSALYPDGLLHADLRGFDPVEQPADTAEVMKGFLDAFGVPAQRMPTGGQPLVGLYRSTLAGRRVLIVLDNARDTDQVRPLLPGAPGCTVVVTSRNRMSGLVAAVGSQPLSLAVLTADEARQFLAARLGERRMAAEAEAVAEIVSCCGGLPLALAIVAARAATDPAQSLAALARQLRKAAGTLDALAEDDRSIDVRAVLSWSYRQLSPAAARLFRLLALRPGGDVGAHAAASLAGLPLAEAQRRLAELAHVHLVAEDADGRCSMHDLLRSYATELVRDEPQAEREAATRRVLDYYLRTAATAALLLTPHRKPLPPLPPEPGAVPEALGDYAAALAWFTAERDAVVSAVSHAAQAGLHHHTWRLASAVEDHLRRTARWSDWAATQRAALAAGEHLDDLAVRAAAHRGLGRAYTRMDLMADADRHLTKAAEHYTALSDANGLADTYLSTSYAAIERDDNALGQRHALAALDGYRDAGNSRGQATALSLLGWCRGELGEHAEAMSCCTEALRLHQELGDRYGEANGWDGLGHVHVRLGDHRSADECYRRALTIYRELGDRYFEADTLANSGANHFGAGDLRATRDAWRGALSILDELGKPAFVLQDAEEVRTKLRLLDELLDPPPRLGQPATSS